MDGQDRCHVPKCLCKENKQTGAHVALRPNYWSGQSPIVNIMHECIISACMIDAACKLHTATGIRVRVHRFCPGRLHVLHYWDSVYIYQSLQRLEFLAEKGKCFLLQNLHLLIFYFAWTLWPCLAVLLRALSFRVSFSSVSPYSSTWLGRGPSFFYNHTVIYPSVVSVTLLVYVHLGILHFF
jgi:hypothetical protein